MDLLKRFTPKNFLGKYPLQKGAKIIGIMMCVVSIICLLVFLVDYFRYGKSENCTPSVLHDVYSFCINAIIYCACMYGVHMWFIWGLKKQKSTVVLAWLVITSMWWLQTACFILIILCVNIVDIGVSWIASLCFAIIAMLFFAYCILVVYGYWLELRNRTIVQETTTTATG